MNYKKVFLIGIGGSSMSGIAMYLKEKGIIVSGSNNEENHNLDILREKNIKVYLGHNANNITDEDLVIYSKAIPMDNPEIIKAKEQNIKLMERAEFIGELTQNINNSICISGTHGKSTTSSMISLCFLNAQKEPTIFLGANLKNINSNYYTGNNEYMILEACEYKDQFLNFYPKAEVILNIDEDHLDYFKTFENIEKSFQKYVTKLPTDGILVTNIDDSSCQKLLELNKGKTITFGINNSCDYQATNIIYDNLGCASFNIKEITINLNVKGIHNIYNALACFAICDYYKIPKDIICKSLSEYSGAERRFELIGTIKDNIQIYDDYAHHPTEIKTTYDSVIKTKHHNSWAIFQSHTYSRTKDHLEEFADILKNFDHIIIAKIYAAREDNIYNVKEDDLVNLIKKDNPNVIYIDEFDKIVNYLEEHIEKDDLVVTIGAGPINQVGYKLLEKNQN